MKYKDGKLLLDPSSRLLEKKQMDRLTYLDALRGGAAIWVVLFHMIFLADPVLDVPRELFFLRMGGMGVTLFFIISGFSLCLTMPKHIETGRLFLSFYMHRVFRVVPLFYFVLFITLYFFSSRGVNFSFEKIILNIILLFNFFPGEQESIVMAGWTIGVEVIFYSVFPFIYFVSRNITHCFVIFVLFLFLGIVSHVIFFDQTFLSWSILRHAPIFVGGCFFSMFLRK